MNREVHVRIWERPEVRILRATRQIGPFVIREGNGEPQNPKTSDVGQPDGGFIPV